jgi:chemotaxis protein CheD
MAVSINPHAILVSQALGSCLAVVLFDPAVHIGGMAHIMLPDSAIDPVRAATRPAMFVDSGVTALLEAVIGRKAVKERLQVYVAGGAQIMDSSGYFNIGKRNVDALHAILHKHALDVHAQQIGGLVNRTMLLCLATGEVRLKVSGQAGEQTLCKN